MLGRVASKRMWGESHVLRVVAIAAVTLAWAPWVLFVAQPLLYLALGASFTLGPVLLIALSPSEKITEFVGFYVMVGNVATVVAPLIVGVLLAAFGGARDGILPDRYELLRRGYGAGVLPPPAPPRRPHPGRQHLTPVSG